MIRCGIEEDTEALLARFFGGLNKEIQQFWNIRNIKQSLVCFILLAKLNVKCRIVNRGQGLIFLQVVRLHGRHANRRPAPVVLHLLLRPTSLACHLHAHRHRVLHQHLMGQLGVRCPREEQGMCNAAVVGVMVTLRKSARHSV